MARRFRALLAFLTLTSATLLGTGTALAAVPSNDTFAGATLVSSLPYDETLDTLDATTDSTDTEANQWCGAPATEASVWYDFTPSTYGGVIVDVSGSSYEAGVIIVSGSPGSLNIESCGPGAVSFYGNAGTEYHILAFSDTAGVNGGTLMFHMEAAPPPPALTISVDKIGHVNAKTGVATISGTWSCTGQADYTEIDGTLSQTVGRFIIRGYFYLEGGPCDGSLQHWTATVPGDNGKFAGGKSAAVAFTYACGSYDCGFAYTESTVMLRK